MATALSIEHKMGSIWITLPDAISMYNSRDIEKSVIGNLQKSSSLVLDFSNTRNLFSSGLGLIIRIRKVATENDCKVCLVNVTEKMRELLAALNLSKLLTIYATDVEYELSRNDLWKDRVIKSLGFLFVAQIENRIYRINLSGEMIKGARFELCEKFIPSPDIAIYIFDFSNLELIDETGATQLLLLTSKIRNAKGECRAFGAEEWLWETIEALGAASYLMFYEDEKSAINNVIKSKSCT
jgi:anti-anti-sigma factor